MPRSRACCGLWMLTALPSTRISPEVAGVMPKIVSAVSVRPEPISPAIPEDLAGPQRQRDVAHHAAKTELAQFQQRRADLGVLLGEQLVDRPSDHHGDQLALVELADRRGADSGAVAQHRHAVGERKDLRQLVADIDDADALLAQHAHDRQQLLDVLLHQRGGRLVHDQHTRIPRQGARDLDPLPVRDRQRTHAVIDVDVLALQPVQQLARPRAHLRPVQRAPLGAWRMAHEDVLRNRQVREQQQFLVHDRDALRRCGARRCEMHGLAIHLHLAAVGAMHAAHDLDQGRFAGAVLAQQGMHFAGTHVERDVLQHADARERFGDAGELDQCAQRTRSRRPADVAPTMRACLPCDDLL